VNENALLNELKSRGIKVESQVPIKVTYKDALVGDYIADLLVEDRVIIELKTVEKLLFKSDRQTGWIISEF
jgi:GxxExxY protein